MIKKKAFLATLAAVVTIPVAVAPFQTEAAVAKPFKDISKANPYYEIIHEMRDKGIISGYEDGTFKPNESISRKHAAALISRAKGSSLPKPKQPYLFKDVSKANPYFVNIQQLQQAGIIEPDAKGNFYPNRILTRAEMAKALTIAFDLEVKSTKDFPDVPASHPANPYVRAIYSNGITTGDNGLFKPNEPLTRAHYAVFMWRAMAAEADALPSFDELTNEQIKNMTNEQVTSYVPLLQRKHTDKIQLPKGEKDAVALTKRLKAEHDAYYLKNRMNFKTEMKLDSRSVYEANTLFSKSFPLVFGSSSKDAMELVNKVYLEGIVVTDENAGVPTNEKFSMYFDYQTGWLIIGILNN